MRLNIQQPLQGDVVLREVVGDWWTFQEIVQTGVYKHTHVHFRVRDGSGHRCQHRFGRSLLASQYKTSRILAVELSPDNLFALLETNLADLVRRSCRTLKAAVWEKCTSLAANPLPGPGRFNGFTTRIRR